MNSIENQHQCNRTKTYTDTKTKTNTHGNVIILKIQPIPFYLQHEHYRKYQLWGVVSWGLSCAHMYDLLVQYN